jgi:hypothetical protein
MPEPILMKYAVCLVSIMDISMEPIQFLHFEDCVWNAFLNFDFKAIFRGNERNYFLPSLSTNSYEFWHSYNLILDNLNPLRPSGNYIKHLL